MATKINPATIAAINKHGALPQRLTTDDGKDIKITNWKCHMAPGDSVVWLEIKGYIVIENHEPERPAD
jgi:hypothetical protein